MSLHAGDAELSDTLTRAPRTFAPTLRGIDAALDAGMTVHLNAVVEQRNHDRLDEHVDLIAARFVDRPTPVRTVQYSQPSQYREAAMRPLGLVPMSAVGPPLARAAKRLLDAGVAVVVSGSCGFPPCLFAEVPELIQAVAAADFEGMDAASRRYAAPCDDCALRGGCMGVRREYLDAFGSDGLRPFAARPLHLGPDESRPVLRRR